MGAFLNVDDYAFHDTSSTLWGWGGQSPVKWNDPTGRCPQCLLAAGGGLIGGIGYGIYYAATAPTNQSWGQFASNAAAAISAGAILGATTGLSAGAAAEATLSMAPSLIGGGAVVGEQALESEEGAFPALSDKITQQLEARGGTLEQIEEAIVSGEQIPAIHKATGNAAIRYVNPDTGQSVVVDTVTNTIIHVGGPGFQYGPASGDCP
jgi:hypothetical protein